MNTNMNDPYAPADAAPSTELGYNGWMTVGGNTMPDDPSYNGWMTVGGNTLPDGEGTVMP